MFHRNVLVRIFAKVLGLFVFTVLTLLRFRTDHSCLPTFSRDCISVAYFDRLFHDTFGSSGGTRTHNPLRAGVFKTPAYAIPPRCHAFAAIWFPHTDSNGDSRIQLVIGETPQSSPLSCRWTIREYLCIISHFAYVYSCQQSFLFVNDSVGKVFLS